MTYSDAIEAVRSMYDPAASQAMFASNALLYEEIIQRIRIASPLDTIETLRGFLHLAYMYGSVEGSHVGYRFVDGMEGDLEGESRQVVSRLLLPWEEDTNA